MHECTTGTDIDATPTYPAAYTNANIMSVIATDENDQLANYSNFGLRNTDIAAPGSKILSTILNGQVCPLAISVSCLLCNALPMTAPAARNLRRCDLSNVARLCGRNLARIFHGLE